MDPLPKDIRTNIEELVAHYSSHKDNFEQFLEHLRIHIGGAKALVPYIHSYKSRVKDVETLRKKLIRKWQDSVTNGTGFELTRDNLFGKINDLAGFRILHLYTQQYRDINQHLKAIFEEQRYPIIEGPIAKTWDDESRRFFAELGIATEDSPTMYTSVHYVIETNSRTSYTCEIQVRTLMEEVWGEVDHAINYPVKAGSLACREQIAALARVTSGCTRLVDSIFRSQLEWQKTSRKSSRVRKPVA